MKIRILLKEDINDVVAKLEKTAKGKYDWRGLAGKIGQFSGGIRGTERLLGWVAKQLLDDNAPVEYHGEMTKEEQMLEAVRLFVENRRFLKIKDIDGYKNQPELLAALSADLRDAAATARKEKKEASPAANMQVGKGKNHCRTMRIESIFIMAKL